MNLYLDASALVKRYVAEPGSTELRREMSAAEAWFICRIGYVEVTRAVALAAGPAATAPIQVEWPAFGIVEVDQALVERAVDLAIKHALRSVDSLHLAAALTLPFPSLQLATWDQRLHAAAKAEGLLVFPGRLT